MNNGSRKQQILEFIKTLNPTIKGTIDTSANLLTDEIVDSVAMMDLIVWFEEHFKVSIDTDDLTPENFGSIDAMDLYLERQ